ncbi:MAG: hypothetical protein HC765_12255 [Brachymonas sp.]|nr:hypothetical protein [Brachymonas sp.]
MRTLSKSKLIAYRQCTKRLWLEIHRPELRADSAATLASFATGHQVGDIARQIYDPKLKGTLIKIEADGFEAAFVQTKQLISQAKPLFEAGFRAGGALAFADVMLPPQKPHGTEPGTWIEVKSSSSVKDYHRDDAAIQAFVAREAKVNLTRIALAHIDTKWRYPGRQEYSGLLVENDLTDEAFARHDEVREWIARAQVVATKRKEPAVSTGAHCSTPFECGFL